MKIKCEINEIKHSDMQYCLDYYCDRKDHAVRTIQKPKGTYRTDYSEIPLSKPYG